MSTVRKATFEDLGAINLRGNGNRQCGGAGGGRIVGWGFGFFFRCHYEVHGFQNTKL